MNYTAGIQASIEKIFAGILVGEAKSDNPQFNNIVKCGKINQARMLANFPSNIFQDEYSIFYSIVVDKKIEVFGCSQLRSLIDNNRDLILNSPYVDLTKLGRLDNGNQLTDDDKIEVIQRNMSELLVTLSNTLVTEEEFNSSCLIFIDYFKNMYMLETAQNMTRIMSDAGFEEKKPNKRTQKYYGFEDSKKYFNERMRILNEISDTDRVKTTIVDGDWYQEDQKGESEKDKDELMTIGIKQIDEMVGSLRRSNMIGVLGPPKGGKTRFTNFLVQRALSLGLNVCVWPLEGTSEEWISMQTAAFIARNHGFEINSKDILQNKLETEQERSIVRTAKFEMVTSNKYGRLSFIESTAYVEDFVSILKAHYENDNPFDVVVIDPLVNIMSKTGKPKVDRISTAYTELKALISHGLKRKVMAIVPAQLKQEVVDFLRAHPNETLDVTSGGESSETVRSPDEVIGLFSTKEERAAGFMKLYSVASRHSAAFDDFQVRTSLKCCHFYDE